MLELYIFDMNFNRLGIVDSFIESKFELNYQAHSIVELIADANAQNVELLMNNDELRIITKSTDVSRGYIIETAEYIDEEELQIIVTAKSLSIMTNWRIIEGQQRIAGNIEDVMKYFVNANCINPVNINRLIPNLVLGLNEGIDINVDETFSNKWLDEALWEVCIRNDMSFEILMNHDDKKYVFSTFIGEECSAIQNVNPHVIFSQSFDNVTLQSYVDDKSNYKSTAYVAGEGEGINRKILKINDDLSGYNRREIFFDARDLQSTYKDINDNDVTLAPAQYAAALQQRGLNNLSEYQRIRTFESEIATDSQFIFNEDFYLGDVVTNRNDDLSIVTHSRVVQAVQTYSRNGSSLTLAFGTSIPTLIDKIKKEVKRK